MTTRLGVLSLEWLLHNESRCCSLRCIWIEPVAANQIPDKEEMEDGYRFQLWALYVLYYQQTSSRKSNLLDLFCDQQPETVHQSMGV
ncbi:hypothetical protein TNCV_4564511 [Trichonephila clavipes]|nr:hypothetical protein TNCV_4564511 [Trichonephila clavipes]